MDDLQLNTALCVWEYLLDYKQKSYVECREDYGVCEMRDAVGGIATWVNLVYSFLDEGFKDYHCFDWDIVPAIVNTILWDAHQYPHFFLPDAAEVAREIGGT